MPGNTNRETEWALWLCDQFASLTDEINTMLPSEWAENNRYLPDQVTDFPGYYDFSLTPYLKEILDLFSPLSPVREWDFMKGVQVGANVGVMENAVGYGVEIGRNIPMMFLTADADLAKLRMETYFTPMFEHSDLARFIKSSDGINKRKTGKTDKKVEWEGGGFLIPFGANSASKLRSTSIQWLLEDEPDAYKLRVGKDGNPSKLAEDRTAAYEASRKIFRASTPLIKQTSLIYKGYMKGDRREFRIPCIHCGFKQALRWSGKKQDGKPFGMTWEIDKDSGLLIRESVRYICCHCGEPMYDDDKVIFLGQGHWEPTATPISPDRRSYHLSALYSPMQTWIKQVDKYLEAWDVELHRIKDVELYQQFYNNVLGWPFEARGEALKLSTVTTHRRAVYSSCTVPNKYAEVEAGGKVQIITAAVDVHKDHLDFQAIGFCVGNVGYSIEHLKIHGDTDDLDNGPWRDLAEILERKVYEGDDGRMYHIQTTLIDAGYKPDIVYSFCSDYMSSVFPVLGSDEPGKNALLREFREYESKAGYIGYMVTTPMYKDRIAAALRKEWDGVSIQPRNYLNFPQDYPDSFFKEFTAETKKAKVNKTTGQTVGYVWHRPSGAPNHALDLTVYSMCALDMIAYDVCTSALKLTQINWARFWEYCEAEQLYFTIDTPTT